MGHRSFTRTKKPATPKQIAAIDTILSRSTRWHWLASRMLRMICFTLGYPIASLQSTHVWVAQFAAAMQAPDDTGVLKTFPLLADLSRRRNGVVVMLLYLSSQHARVQFHADARADTDQVKDVRPYRILDSAHPNATRMLTRMLGAAVGCTGQGYGSTGLAMRAVRRILRWLMGPGDPDISVYAAMRWLSLADIAAGLAPRRPDSLQKSHSNRKSGPLSAITWAATRAYIHDTYFPSTVRAIISVALACGYLLIPYYAYRLISIAAHHIM